ncbi:MAG: polysaccharide deacetylase family protein [Chthoniobacteraceae bacterium]
MLAASRLIITVLLSMLLTLHSAAVAPIPDKLVVLTFDDSVASHATFVAPLLKKYGFGATFFVTEGFEFNQDKEHYMTWEQIQSLDAAGFEIGNHTRNHAGVAKQKPEQLAADVEYIEQQCVKNGIPRTTSFCYPGYQTSRVSSILRAGL